VCTYGIQIHCHDVIVGSELSWVELKSWRPVIHAGSDLRAGRVD
jgi:hypothetical protein